MKVTLAEGDVVDIDTDDDGQQVVTVEFKGDWDEIEQQIRRNRKKERDRKKREALPSMAQLLLWDEARKNANFAEELRKQSQAYGEGFAEGWLKGYETAERHLKDDE